MRRTLMMLLLLPGFLLPGLALAKPVIADLDSYHISINSSFNGQNLLLFGMRDEPGDLVIVIRGPERDATLRKKTRRFGIWVNTEQMQFRSVPAYYAVTGTRPLEELASSKIYGTLKLGLNNLELQSAEASKAATRQEFIRAYLGIQQHDGLYQSFAEPMNFMADSLFKTVAHFPDTLPRGNYSAEIYLIDDGILRGMQTIPIEVTKEGFDAFVYDMSETMPLLYGVLAVLIAIGAGWAVSYIFGRLMP